MELKKCFICGQELKIITATHVKKHGFKSIKEYEDYVELQNTTKIEEKENFFDMVIRNLNEMGS